RRLLRVLQRGQCHYPEEIAPRQHVGRRITKVRGPPPSAGVGRGPAAAGGDVGEPLLANFIPLSPGVRPKADVTVRQLLYVGLTSGGASSAVVLRSTYPLSPSPKCWRDEGLN